MVKKIMLLSVLLLLPLMMLSAESLTIEQVTADIKPETLYPGSLVITAITELMMMYEAEMETVAQEAKAEAVSIMTTELEKRTGEYAVVMMDIRAELNASEKKRDAFRTLALAELGIIAVVGTVLVLILR